jgi:hypothetical protein
MTYTYILHWLGGKTEEVKGETIADAFTKAGYGAGALLRASAHHVMLAKHIR